MLCGAVVLRPQHVGILQTIAWYGWSFWAVEGLLQRAEILRAIWLTIVLALVSLAGSPQMFHMLISGVAGLGAVSAGAQWSTKGARWVLGSDCG
jgi:hypothetical protein